MVTCVSGSNLLILMSIDVSQSQLSPRLFTFEAFVHFGHWVSEILLSNNKTRQVDIYFNFFITETRVDQYGLFETNCHNLEQWKTIFKSGLIKGKKTTTPPPPHHRNDYISSHFQATYEAEF